MKIARGSKLMAWHMVYMSFILGIYAISKGHPDVASTAMLSGFVSAAALYSSKQWSDAKVIKTTNKE